MKRNYYLERYAWHSIGLAERITGQPDIIVVIPAHAEENLNATLHSIHSCSPPHLEVAVLILINEAEDASEEITSLNYHCLEQLNCVKTIYPQYVEYVKLPAKKAGVGLARKIGMDEAVRFFEKHNKNGILVCFDADCTCSPNYLQSIADFFEEPSNQLGMVHFEHRLEGPNEQAITRYELFLRYYINGLRISRYPMALQTLGSCITVKSRTYQKQGGMNTRKAGEDFYFIHKISPLGGVGEINSTTVMPSDRVSNRVPFGTGFAIQKYLEAPDTEYASYSHRIFEDLRAINSDLDKTYHSKKQNNLPHTIEAFYQTQKFSLQEIINQSGSYENFIQRYYQWWDAFKVMKFIHFARDHFYPNQPLQHGVEWLNQNLELNITKSSVKDQLLALRQYDRDHPFHIKW